jgi:hypothetical protein
VLDGKYFANHSSLRKDHDFLNLLDAEGVLLAFNQGCAAEKSCFQGLARRRLTS